MLVHDHGQDGRTDHRLVAGRVLVGVDIFTVWQAVVTAIGLAIVGQIAKGKAIGGVLALVAIAIVVGEALGGLGSVTTQP